MAKNSIEKQKTALIAGAVVVLLLSLGAIGGGIAMVIVNALALAAGTANLAVGIVCIVIGAILILAGLWFSWIGIKWIWVGCTVKATNGSIADQNLCKGTVNGKVCPKCGCTNTGDVTVCQSCGAPLDGAQDTVNK